MPLATILVMLAGPAEACAGRRTYEDCVRDPRSCSVDGSSGECVWNAFEAKCWCRVRGCTAAIPFLVAAVAIAGAGSRLRSRSLRRCLVRGGASIGFIAGASVSSADRAAPAMILDALRAIPAGLALVLLAIAWIGARRSWRDVRSWPTLGGLVAALATVLPSRSRWGPLTRFSPGSQPLARSRSTASLRPESSLRSAIRRPPATRPAAAAERVAQARAVAGVAIERGAAAIAHGSTAAGNDQIRFDLVVAAVAPDLEILTPVRDLGWSRRQRPTTSRSTASRSPRRGRSTR